MNLSFIKSLFGRRSGADHIQSASNDQRPRTEPTEKAQTSEADPAAVEYINDWIDIWARSGFGTLASLTVDLHDILYEEDLPPEHWVSKLEAEFLSHAETEKNFPETTANDRLTSAFQAMNDAGLIALENAGYTQSDGWSDIHEIKASTRPEAIGGVFYHGQDLERAVFDNGVGIRYGGFEKGADRQIGEQVVSILNAHGIGTQWSGDPTSVIDTVPFVWQRRRRADGQ